MSCPRDDGKAVGLDIALARLMPSPMDAKLTVETLPFAALLSANERLFVNRIQSSLARIEGTGTLDEIGKHLPRPVCSGHHDRINKVE